MCKICVNFKFKWGKNEMEKIRDNIPEKYLENRDTIEGRLILAFWKQPELLDEYKLNPKDDLVNEDSRLLKNV